MSAPVDWADTANTLRELHDFLEQEHGTDLAEDAAFANAAKLCEAMPLVFALLHSVGELPAMPVDTSGDHFDCEVQWGVLRAAVEAAAKLREAINERG